MKRAFVAGVLAAAPLLTAAVGGAQPPASLVEQWNFPAGDLAERHPFGRWFVTYAGFGTVRLVRDGTPALELTPQPATSPDVTHAALVTSLDVFGDLELTAAITTVKQLRVGAPNPWEVGWLLWHYRDDDHFYYLSIKPNGWELGKRVPGVPGNQRFLAGGAHPVFALGQHVVHVLQVRSTIEVACDGELLGTYTDDNSPYLNGRLGLYTEDAQVRFGPLQARSVP